jgi:hypothetical protein
MIERAVTSELMRIAALMHEAERDCRNGRPDCGAGNSVHNLRAGDNDESGSQQDRNRRQRDSDRRSDDNRAFGTGPVDQSAERRRDRHAGDAADGHDSADLGRRPVPGLQEYAEERAEAAGNVGHKEIERIEREERRVHGFNPAPRLDVGCNQMGARKTKNAPPAINAKPITWFQVMACCR